jgi:hypothetical protein
MTPIKAPSGFWRVLTVIAERIPQDQLIWLAVLLCVLILGLAGLTYASVSRAVESKPAAALTGYLKQSSVHKVSEVP